MFTPKSKAEAMQAWQDAQYQRGCTCFISAQCSFCVDGFALDLEEYLEFHGFGENNIYDAYDRAMSII